MFVFTLTEIIVVCIVLFMALHVMYISLKNYIKQSRCKHDGGIRETMSCDAICKKCGKNLGFIGTDENKVRRLQ